MTSAFLNCASGISGDMLLGALLDAGAPLGAVRAAVGLVVHGGWELETTQVRRGGVRATRALVTATDDRAERRVSEILGMIGSAGLPTRVESVARSTIEALSGAEARVHGEADPLLHEAGGIDAIVDVVGSAAALHLLDVEQVFASPIATGSGSTRSSHGAIPVPAPAVVELLRGAPLRILDTGDELVTPTGAALLAGVSARFETPTITVVGQGFGAGARDPKDRANVLHLVLGHVALAPRPMVVIEANIDDATPEVLAHTVERALALGAADAWLAPILMKKGRPGTTVHLLSEPAAAAALEELVLRETGSFGIRRHAVDRRALDRDWLDVDVDGQKVRVKRALLDGRAVTLAPEYEDARAAAAALGRPLREVMAKAVSLARGLSSSAS